MTLFQRIEAIEPKLAQLETDVAALKAAPAADQTVLADLSAKVDALRADVGTPTPPAA